MSRQINIKLENDLYERVKAMSDRTGVSMSFMIRQALERQCGGNEPSKIVFPQPIAGQDGWQIGNERLSLDGEPVRELEIVPFDEV